MQLPFIRFKGREKAIKRKTDKILKDMKDGRLTPEKAMKQIVELGSTAPLKSIVQFGKELEKQK